MKYREQFYITLKVSWIRFQLVWSEYWTDFIHTTHLEFFSTFTLSGIAFIFIYIIWTNVVSTFISAFWQIRHIASFCSRIKVLHQRITISLFAFLTKWRYFLPYIHWSLKYLPLKIYLYMKWCTQRKMKESTQSFKYMKLVKLLIG